MVFPGKSLLCHVGLGCFWSEPKMTETQVSSLSLLRGLLLCFNRVLFPVHAYLNHTHAKCVLCRIATPPPHLGCSRDPEHKHGKCVDVRVSDLFRLSTDIEGGCHKNENRRCSSHVQQTEAADLLQHDPGEEHGAEPDHHHQGGAGESRGDRGN